ncbi:hypothetical protein NQ318_006484 [Aromia moschata]|uniref:Uncharacterized protein n=1 Tax=Aromia moschata TaxID=1265417 RepID=A0AAV8X3M4_9CUCU|nr:hypothetical protein NQ318_006484 [Aromia moschata]
MPSINFLAICKPVYKFFLHILKDFRVYYVSCFLSYQAAEDADVLIVTTVLSQSPNFDCVFIISEDVDVLVLLTGIPSSTKTNLYMLKPGKSGKPSTFSSTSSYNKLIVIMCLYNGLAVVDYLQCTENELQKCIRTVPAVVEKLSSTSIRSLELACEFYLH